MATRGGNRIFGGILALLLAGSLVGFGAQSLGPARTASVATVDGLEVGTQDYYDALTAGIAEFGERFQQRLTLADAQALGLDRQVLAALVSNRVLDAEAARLGLSAGDARVAEAVRADPEFRGLSGQFDRTAYREALRSRRQTEREHEDALREDIARGVLQAAVRTGLPEPEALADTLAAWRSERRVVTWAELPASTVAATLPEPTEGQVRAWYDANPDRYTAPELRRIAYAWVTPEMVQDPAAIPEADVRALYDGRRDDYVQPERRLVERLVMPDAAAAEAALARLDAGEADFEALVEERGLRLSDADLGDVDREELGPAANAVFAAASGDVVGPVETSLGPALFRVNAVLAADEIPFEEAEPDLRAELADGVARRAIADEVARIDDLIAGGAAVEDLAEQTLLEPGAIDWSRDVTEGIAAYAPFREAAAAAEPGAFPELVELGDGGVAVLRLDEVVPPTLRPFDEVQAEAQADARAEAVTAATLAEARRLAEAIAGGVSFEDGGLTPRTEGPRTRSDVIEGAPPGTVAAAFDLQPGAATALASPAGAVVLRLDAVEPAPEGDPTAEAEREAIAGAVSEAQARDLLDAFAARLQAGAEVRIDEAALQAVHAQVQ